MPITPLNIEEFATEDELFVFQMIEPIVMEGDTILREGTAILGNRYYGNKAYNQAPYNPNN